MGQALDIRDDTDAAELRRLARREPGRRTAMRMLAIANALSGMSRASAAASAGMERQALRDAVVRYNAEGPKGDRSPLLTEGEEATPAAVILRGPDPEKDGCCSWTRTDLVLDGGAAWQDLHPSSLSPILKRMGFSRQKARPRHPRTDGSAQAAFVKRGSATP